MSANNLFSFIDSPEDDNDEDIVLQDGIEQGEPFQNDDRPPTPTSTLKRKASSPTQRPSQQHGDSNIGPGSQLDENAHTKRARLRSPNPVVLDDFETEAKREVAASAGLTGAVAEAGSRLELRHQVNFSAFLGRYLANEISGSTSSCSASRLQLYPNITTCATCKTRPRIQV
jgi:ATP-dependent RNA helicase DOB1